MSKIVSGLGPHLDCNIGKGIGKVKGFSMCNTCSRMNTGACKNSATFCGSNLMGAKLH